ncbi:MAG: hypothetical protein KC431_15275, partial [Myxococcales bacterium]|nr:hypothetical protein [Myxococcales bacterium]
ALLSGGACAGSQAHLEWRPGLSAGDFDGLFELSRDDYLGFSEQAEPNTVIDRRRGTAWADASVVMARIGASLDGSLADAHGHALVSLSETGAVGLSGGKDGGTISGEVDWLATINNGEVVALLSGNKLAVVHGGASTGIDLGSLLGSGAAGHRLMLLMKDGELTVFALPEIGGAIAANEPGYVFSFSYRPGTKQGWDISVARVTVSM